MSQGEERVPQHKIERVGVIGHGNDWHGLGRAVPGLRASGPRERSGARGRGGIAALYRRCLAGPGGAWHRSRPAPPKDLLTCHAESKGAVSEQENAPEHESDQLGPPLESWWGDLGTPRLTPEVRQDLTSGVVAEAGDRDIAASAAERDRFCLTCWRQKKRI